MVELFFSKHLNVVVCIFFYAKRKHFFVKRKRMPSDTCYKFSFVICFTWQNAKCYCVVNTHSSLLQQLFCHILYTTNTCTTHRNWIAYVPGLLAMRGRLPALYLLIHLLHDTLFFLFFPTPPPPPLACWGGEASVHRLPTPVFSYFLTPVFRQNANVLKFKMCISCSVY